MEYKIFDTLPNDALQIRLTVFTDEQGFKNELDELDDGKKAKHIVLYDNEKPIATARYYEEAPNVYRAGRIAVLKPYRGKGYGREVLTDVQNELEKIGAKKITISAQVRAQGFYEALGYTAMGETYPDEGVPHIHMEKEI
jgi:predicted GNAT family N-acyltransferase